ncbi:MAG: hypothetical protein AB1483_13480 [Candidatus Zixiibacteriota bacterium]
MKRIFCFSAVSVLVSYSQAMAANLAVIVSPPTALKIVILGIAVGCVVVSLKVVNVLKGGLLSRSWQILMLAFAVLAVSQLTGLLQDTEIIAIPSFVVPVLWVAMAGLFLFGIFEAKKILD